jgi:predicted esterase
MGLIPLSLLLSGCGQTSGKDFPIIDFGAVHSPVNTDANTYLIFGNLPVPQPAQDLSTDLAAFLGRWEGYDYSPPVKMDYKIVLVIQDISTQGGTAFLWLGTNLQYPSSVQEIHFQVISGTPPAIEFRTPFGKATQTVRLIFDADKKILRSPDDTHRPLELGRGQSFYVYKDYSQYLAGKRIYSKVYQETNLPKYGKGYLVYLPEGYTDNPTKTWPLIFFLHGSGDRGENVYLLAKASPFMMIREKGPLPFIIVAPLLKTSYNLFPIEYLDGVLSEVQTGYRVDPKRIYVTGLSLGGEATYRLAIHQPDALAAIAPLSAALGNDQIAQLDRIKNLPVWAIHGANDTIIPLVEGRKPVDALIKLGGNIRFTVLEGHDHDTWTDTYSDPAFYDWFLQHQRP